MNNIFVIAISITKLLYFEKLELCRYYRLVSIVFDGNKCMPSLMHFSAFFYLCLTYFIGTAFPLSGLIPMITNTSVIVMWTYNNSANAVPATSFIANVTLNGVDINAITNPININAMSVTIPSTVLEGEQTYMVSVVARNLQGDSQPVTREFMTPRSFSGAAGKFIP